MAAHFWGASGHHFVIMAQTAKRHSDSKRQREAQHFVKHLLDELLAYELDAPVATPQPNEANATPDDRHSVNPDSDA